MNIQETNCPAVVKVYTCFPFIDKPGALRPDNQLILPALTRRPCQPEAKDSLRSSRQSSAGGGKGIAKEHTVPILKKQPASERIEGFAPKIKEYYLSALLDEEFRTYKTRRT